jgi:hypothetical protein
MHTATRGAGLKRGLLGILGVGVVGAAAATVLTRNGASREVTLPAGTALVAALSEAVSTESSEVGDAIELETVEPAQLDDGSVVPAGMTLRGEVTESKGGGRIAGSPELALSFRTLEVDGESHPISANPFRVRGTNDAAESAATIGGGAVVGGVVGKVLGDKTLEGAAAGAIIGTGVAIATKGDQLFLPKGQKLRVRLASPVTIRYSVTDDAEP